MTRKMTESVWIDDLVNQCLSEPVPDAIASQLRTATRRHPEQGSLGRSGGLTRRKLLATATAAAAGGLMVGVSMFSSSAPQAWGQVAAQAQQKPWMHISGVHTNGASMEFWSSFETQTFAAKFGETEFAHFQRASDQTNCWYRKSEGFLVEGAYRPMPGEFGHLEHLFHEMASGESVARLAGPDEILSQSQRVLEVDGKRRWEYEFSMRAVDEGHEDTYTVVFLVDPISKLPIQWTRYKQNETDRLVMQIDYPASGPTSIFDLGVPIDVERKQRSGDDAP